MTSEPSTGSTSSTDDDADDGALQEAAGTARDRVAGVLPPTLQRAIEGATQHHTLTLAAGLAFFGLLSFAPAVALSLGVLRLVVGDQAVQQLVGALQNSYSETLGFSQLLEQMQGQAVRYAGAGLVLLLWPATTLASGWTRALDAVEDNESPPGVRGVMGRLKGLALGLLLMVGVLGLLGATILGNRAIESTLVVLLLGAVVAGAFAFQARRRRRLTVRARPASRTTGRA